MNNGAKKSKTLSGMIMYVMSETKMMTNKDIKVQAMINSFDHPTSNGEIVKRIAVASSIEAYIGDMWVLQFRHLPLCNMYEKTGINSIAVSWCLQVGHAERGLTIDWPAGMRRPTTLKKEPKSRP
jgi:hypothetical protein